MYIDGSTLLRYICCVKSATAVMAACEQAPGRGSIVHIYMWYENRRRGVQSIKFNTRNTQNAADPGRGKHLAQVSQAWGNDVWHGLTIEANERGRVCHDALGRYPR